MDNPLKYFAELRDPRVERTRKHWVEEILLMAIAAILSGANGWNEIEDYARCKREWLKSFLTLPGGIPRTTPSTGCSPRSIRRSWKRASWPRYRRLPGSRRAKWPPSTARPYGARPAWANANGLVLAQRKVDEKSNEITAIPKLLDALELSGMVITIDAMGWQPAIAEKKANYILAGKKRTRAICWKRSRTRFRCSLATPWPRKSIAVMAGSSHGPAR